MTELVEISNRDLRLTLAPRIGGAITAFRSEGRHGVVDWMRPTDPAALAKGDVLGTACFPLVPYSNRIRDAAFRFGDHAVRLDHAFPHALHGHGWLAPWTVEARATDRATLSFTRSAGDWPWAYRAEQRFVLHAHRLDVTLSLQNLGTTPMPAGMGLHPYFPRTPGTVLTAAIDAMWETDAAILPTVLVDPDSARDPRRGLAVDRVPLDNCYTGWNGRAVIDWPERRARLTMSGQGPYTFFVVYTPSGKDHFCAEPVSNATDAVNLVAQGRDDTGLRVLAPGERLEALASFAPELLPGRD